MKNESELTRQRGSEGHSWERQEQLQRPWGERRCGTFEKAKEIQCGWNRVGQDEPGEWARVIGWKPDHVAPMGATSGTSGTLWKGVRQGSELIAIFKNVLLAAVERTD